MSAVGIGLYALQLSVATDPAPQQPVLTSLNLTESGAKELGERLGTGCDLDAVPIVVTHAEAGSSTALVAGGGCNTAEITVDQSLGAITYCTPTSTSGTGSVTATAPPSPGSASTCW